MKEQTKPFVGVLRYPRGPEPPCTRPPLPPHLQRLGQSPGDIGLKWYCTIIILKILLFS